VAAANRGGGSAAIDIRRGVISGVAAISDGAAFGGRRRRLKCNASAWPASPAIPLLRSHDGAYRRRRLAMLQ